MASSIRTVHDDGMQRGIVIGTAIAFAVLVGFGVASALANRGGTISGSVVTADGDPVEDALVTASYREWAFQDGQLLWDNPVIFEMTTNASGRFRLSYEGRNRVTVRVFATGFETLQLTAGGSEVLELVVLEAEPFVQPGPRERRPDETWTSYYCDELDRSTDFVRVEYPGGLVEIADTTFVGDEDVVLHPVRSVARALTEGWVYRPGVSVEGFEEGTCADFVVLSSRPEELEIPELRLLLPLD